MSYEARILLADTLKGMNRSNATYEKLVSGVASRLKHKPYRREMIPVLLDEKFKVKLFKKFHKTCRELYKDAVKMNGFATVPAPC